jgi:hypothetical protein
VRVAGRRELGKRIRRGGEDEWIRREVGKRERKRKEEEKRK